MKAIEIILYVLSAFCFAWSIVVYLSNAVAHYRFMKITGGRAYQGQTPSVVKPLLAACLFLGLAKLI